MSELFYVLGWATFCTVIMWACGIAYWAWGKFTGRDKP